MKDEFLNIEDSFKDINNANNLDDLNEQYVDKFATVQQKYRDEHITKLLELYVNFYSDKTKANKKYKTILFYFCLSVIFVFSVFFVYIICKEGFKNDKLSNLISVCITFISLIIGILTIITKYVFPKRDEEYITTIVEIIQNNDLENKRENIKINKKF